AAWQTARDVSRAGEAPCCVHVTRCRVRSPLAVRMAVERTAQRRSTYASTAVHWSRSRAGSTCATSAWIVTHGPLQAPQPRRDEHVPCALEGCHKLWAGTHSGRVA